MCGIFGVVSPAGSTLQSRETFSKMVDFLFNEAQSRGMESSGFVLDDGSSLKLLKTNLPANKLLKLTAAKSLIEDAGGLARPKTLIGHSRMVTNGDASLHQNNQPVFRDNLCVVHNGIITNEPQLWQKHSLADKQSDVDSELIPYLLRKSMDAGSDLNVAIAELFSEISGAASFAALGADLDCLMLASNTGSLYVLHDKNITVFASEYSMLVRFVLKFSEQKFKLNQISQLTDGKGVFINLETGQKMLVPKTVNSANKAIEKSFEDVTPEPLIKRKLTKTLVSFKKQSVEFNFDEISALRRCSKCVLPETFPFIYFNQAGVCNYCLNYVPKAAVDRTDDLEIILDKYRSTESIGDCIVALSGGRDSTYALHLLKTRFAMNPITFTYDWGMVTDIARQNMAEITGQLGVENILVSANIPQKLKYIRENVSAWLKAPDLGIIPLFMAGDKFFFKYVNQVKKDTGIKLDIWSPNFYENTDFKTGFCGIPPMFDKQDVDQLGLKAKLQLPMYYLQQFIKNPSYFNSSMIDTIGAYWSYYYEPRKNICFTFDYLPWDENAVESCLINQYGWEVDAQSGTTWRRGDGTAPFYNYIYYTVAGFSEFDTFRSNQIREGAITREEGLARIERENQPNIEGIEWYFNRIGLEAEPAIKIINGIPKLYRQP